MIQLPFFNTLSSRFTYNVILESQTCLLDLDFNTRNQCFHLSFTDGADNIVRGIKIVPNFPLLKYKKGFTDLQGDLMVSAISNTAENSEITYDNIGVDYQLFYLTPEEVREWEADNGI